MVRLQVNNRAALRAILVTGWALVSVDCSNSGERSLTSSTTQLAIVAAASTRWTADHVGAGDLAVDSLNALLGAAGFGRLAVEGGGRDGGKINPDELWRTKNHVFGYVPTSSGSAAVGLRDAFSITPDKSMLGARLKVTLDRLHVERYPGKGMHDIAFNFFAVTQSEHELVPVTYSVGFSARQGDDVATVGKSIFVGLAAGMEGLNFKGATINVNTEKDKTFFSILSGNVFAKGLQILTTKQPAIAPLTELVDGVSKELAAKDKGVPVQAFEMGLDASTVSTRAKLREGSYVIVQVPPALEREWRWEDWQVRNGRIERKLDGITKVPFNYMIIGVSRMKGGR